MRKEAPPFVRIPPFPGARPAVLARRFPEPGRIDSKNDIDGLIRVLADERVGGTYWGTQPSLPTADYAVVAVRDPSVRKELSKELSRAKRVVFWNEAQGCDPWHVVERAAEVWVDADNELALIAAIAGRYVTCMGEGPFGSLASGTGRAQALRDAVHDHVAGVSYADPFTGDPIDARQAIEVSAFWRRLIDGNRSLVAAVGFASWKQPTVAPLLWGGVGTPRFRQRSSSIGKGDRVAVWRSRASKSTLRMLETIGAQLVEVEDGFIRSTGLGADCVPPLSIIVDTQGIYFDAARPSDLETILQEGEFTPDLLTRAKALRQLIVEEGISKYEAGPRAAVHRRSGPPRILVPGQVEDDRAVAEGGQGLTSNLELLRLVRGRAPDACILYKPHPDVEAGHRVGAIADKDALALANDVVRNVPFAQLIDTVDEVHVNTSLAGFEALLREKQVTTYGVPFYAGWGITTDVGAVPGRRTARRSLDEVVAAALILYPRYLDPRTGLPCSPEFLVRRLSAGATRDPLGLLVWLRRLQGGMKRQLARIGA